MYEIIKIKVRKLSEFLERDDLVSDDEPKEKPEKEYIWLVYGPNRTVVACCWSEQEALAVKDNYEQKRSSGFPTPT